MRESYQNIRLSFYISWEPGSQISSEFAALLMSLATSTPAKELKFVMDTH